MGGKGSRRIEPGDCPEGTDGVVKFLTERDGWRGILLATNEGETEGIVLSITGGQAMSDKPLAIREGGFYLVRASPDGETWPVAVRQVDGIPGGWKVVGWLASEVSGGKWDGKVTA